MRGVNKVILVGTLGRDPETKTFPSGGSITQFSIATSEQWTDKNTGERQESTEWHRIVLSNRLGEVAQQYLRKGSKVYIEGSLRTRKWTDKDGIERYSTEVRGDSMQMLDSRQGAAGGADQSGYGGYDASYGAQNAVSYQNNSRPAASASADPYPEPAPRPKAAPSAAPSSYAESELDDDLPF